MKRTILSTILFLLWVGVAGPAGTAAAMPDAPTELGGRLEAELDGRSIAFPVLTTDLAASIQGDLATVTVTQTFANPADRPVHATYLFPLNKDAAVTAMRLQVGDERVEARIQEAEQAKATFDSAKRAGKGAALLEQHRPNMFTQSVANLMPGLPVTVTLRLVQPVPKLDGAYELVLPTVVGPRFQPPAPAAPPSPDAAAVPEATGPTGEPTRPPPAIGVWQLDALPAYPPVSDLTVPKQIDADRLSITIDLNGGVPVQAVSSATHALTIDAPSDRTRRITLAAGRTLANRDFVLRYRLAATETQAGVLAHADARGGFFSLLLEPPAAPTAEQIAARELVFLLDTSGSMEGWPMALLKTFVKQALADLRPSDRFRIVQFGDQATEMPGGTLSATPANIGRARAYTDRLYASGGTYMTRGLDAALAPAPPADALRIVVFLTDAYVSNETEVLRQINRQLGSGRMVAIGVGSAVNRHLLAEIGRVGRGFARHLDGSEPPETVAKALAERLRTPVLTDIAIDWGDLTPTDLVPDPIPDLYAGDSLRVLGRYTDPGTYTLHVRGRIGGRDAVLPLTVSLPGPAEGGPTERDPAEEGPTERGESEAVALAWARAAIGEAMRRLAMPPDQRRVWDTDDALRRRVTKLGLEFALATRWTSFVAVTERVVNSEPAGTPVAAVPLSQVAGVSASAYPQGRAGTLAAPAGPGIGQPTAPAGGGGAPTGGFTGNAAPEPAETACLVLVASLFAWLLYRRRRRPAMVA